LVVTLSNNGTIYQTTDGVGGFAYQGLHPGKYTLAIAGDTKSIQVDGNGTVTPPIGTIELPVPPPIVIHCLPNQDVNCVPQ
jgi:hypothetical protein